ncbi:hypothetical protein HOE425_300066 [Hoeflea sp. EC-HK425]|nr:hypothetical protein HOE425_300066 [Hoeflea sp. EC-HK425]
MRLARVTPRPLLFNSQADLCDRLKGKICHAFSKATRHPFPRWKYHPISKARRKTSLTSFGSAIGLASRPW